MNNSIDLVECTNLALRIIFLVYDVLLFVS